MPAGLRHARAAREPLRLLLLLLPLRLVHRGERQVMLGCERAQQRGIPR
jgi:hypothetical protein